MPINCINFFNYFSLSLKNLYRDLFGIKAGSKITIFHFIFFYPFLESFKFILAPIDITNVLIEYYDSTWYNLGV